MRLLLIACFAVLALSVQSAPNQPFDDEIFTLLIKRMLIPRDDITPLLKKAMEKFRILMLKGDPDLDLPVMDPYVMDHREIALNLTILTGKASVDNLAVSGMSTYVVQAVSGNDAPLHADFDLKVPDVKCLADQYQLDTMVADKYHIFGKGILNMSAQGMRLLGGADGAVDAEQHLTVTKLSLSITAEGITSALTGLMNNDDECKLANEIISEFGPQILEKYGSQLGDFFGNIIREIINTKIAGLTVQEIIDLINS